MTDTLATFAEQVTNVAREVGVEGRLGGQANVPGAAGTWKDLTGNVNLLAANLTNQVRAIADVATAVTKGDLTRSIQVEARGEVAELKDNINTMIDNLRGTTDRNQEQDWLKTNLAKFTRMLQGQRDLVTVGKMLLSELAPLVDAQQGTIYQMERSDPASADRGAETLRLLAGYAQRRRSAGAHPRSASGSSGRRRARSSASCCTTCRADYTPIHSSLGARAADEHRRAAGAVRGRDDGRDRARGAAPVHRHPPQFLDQLTQSIGVVLNTIEATMRTENLLQQSQQLTDRAADAADRAAADERGARVEGQAARRAERRGRAQEQGGRAGAPRARGEGRRARAHVASTSPSSSRTCRTSCARRSTRSSSSASSSPRTSAAT